MNLAALFLLAAASVVPPQPTSFETVNVRMPVDSCGYEPNTVRVSMQSNVISVTHTQTAFCSPPGATVIVDVRLGALPAGDYRVELFNNVTPGTMPPTQTISFQVRDPAAIAVVPPPPRPLTDYTGLWFNPSESGWGLSLYQGATHNMFGVFFVYDANGQPEWYSLQGGRWSSSTAWSATVFRTTGPVFWAGAFDPAQVHYLNAGQAQIEFRQSPGEEGTARFTYTVNGVSSARTIRRIAL